MPGPAVQVGSPTQSASPASGRRSKKRKVTQSPTRLKPGSTGLPEQLGDKPLRLVIVGSNPSDHAWCDPLELSCCQTRLKLANAKLQRASGHCNAAQEPMSTGTATSVPIFPRKKHTRSSSLLSGSALQPYSCCKHVVFPRPVKQSCCMHTLGRCQPLPIAGCPSGSADPVCLCNSSEFGALQRLDPLS